MPDCQHTWEAFKGVPFGEPPTKHHKCSLCEVIGYRKPRPYHARMRANRPPRTYPYMCADKNCRELATVRNHGRNGRGALIFVCEKHRVEHVG